MTAHQYTYSMTYHMPALVEKVAGLNIYYFIHFCTNVKQYKTSKVEVQYILSLSNFFYWISEQFRQCGTFVFI